MYDVPPYQHHPQLTSLRPQFHQVLQPILLEESDREILILQLKMEKLKFIVKLFSYNTIYSPISPGCIAMDVVKLYLKNLQRIIRKKITISNFFFSF